MEYWKNDLKLLESDDDVKETSMCITNKFVQSNETSRVCFDDVGVPVMPNAVFGKLRCN